MLKKIFFVIIIFVSIFCIFSVSDSFALEGDLNGDGKVGVRDAIYALQISSGVRMEVLGGLEISRSPASLGNQQVPSGREDVEFFTARIITEQPMVADGVMIDLVEMKNMDFSSLNSCFENFRFFINDILISEEYSFGIVETCEEAKIQLIFDESFELKGTSNLKIVADIKEEAVSGSAIKLEFSDVGFFSLEYLSTGKQVPQDRINGSVTGSFVEVQNSELIFSRYDAFKDQEFVMAGESFVNFMSFIVDNNDLGDVKITYLRFLVENAEGFNVAIEKDGFPYFETKVEYGEAIFRDLFIEIPSKYFFPLNLRADVPVQVGGGTKIKFKLIEVQAHNLENGKSVETKGLTLESAEFNSYKTRLSIDHSGIQPSISDPSMASQAVYYFRVKNQGSWYGDLGRVSLDVNLMGMEAEEGGLNFTVKSIDPETMLIEQDLNNYFFVEDTSFIEGDKSAVVKVDFNSNTLKPEEMRIYALFLGNSRNDLSQEADDDVISVRILTDEVETPPSDIEIYQKTSARIIWSDVSGSPYHSEKTKDWFNGKWVEVDRFTKINRD